MQSALDSGYPIQVFLITGVFNGQQQGHDVMVTGYSGSNFIYYDSETLTYKTTYVTNLNLPVGILGGK